MSLGKNDIVKNIAVEAQISKSISKEFLNKFLDCIKKNSKSSTVKLSNFGSFYTHVTPKRLGRNPITKEEFLIKPRHKILYKTSSKVRNILN